MRALLPVLALSLTSIVAAQSAGAPPPRAAAPDAATILDEVWAALGEPDALEALGVVRMKGQAQALTSDFKGPFEELYHSDGRALQRIEFGGSDPVYFGVDGRVSWEAWSDQGVAKFDWHAASDLRRFFLHRHAASPGRRAPGSTAPWRALYRDAAVGGRAEVDGKACVRLVLTPRPEYELGLAQVAERRAPDPDVLWVDEETRLPVRLELEMLRPAEGEVRLKETFRDWQEFGGVRFPMTRLMEVPGAGVEFRCDTIELGCEVASAAFDLPLTLTATLLESYPHAVRLPEISWQVVGDNVARPALALRVTCPLTELPARVAEAQRELLALVAELGGAVAGEARAGRVARVGRGIDAELEVVAPLQAPLAIPEAYAARLRALELPAGMYVQGPYAGPFTRLDEVHLRLDDHLRRHRLVARGPALASLFAAPDALDDPTAWATVVSVPVAPRD